MAARRSGARGAATLEEVAHVAGVSRATVSRVINGNPRVSPDVLRAVERAVERLGYTPNRAARSLVTRRSDSVGLVIPEPTTRLFGDPFFPRLVRGISDVIGARDLQLILLTPQSSADEARLEQYLLAGHVDGVLLVSLHGADPLPRHLADHGVPLVVGGRPALDADDISYVDVDNVHGARAAVRHLLEHGRRRIGTISGPLDMVAGQDRLSGYRAALREAGAAQEPALEATGDFSQASGTRAMAELLARAPDLDAVFVASDLMAVGALQALRDAGRAVPGDVAVVGFDDSPIAPTTEPSLTSIRQPIEEMGREMARLLLRQIGSPDRVARRVVLNTELIIRGSSGRAATG